MDIKDEVRLEILLYNSHETLQFVDKMCAQYPGMFTDAEKQSMYPREDTDPITEEEIREIKRSLKEEICTDTVNAQDQQQVARWSSHANPDFLSSHANPVESYFVGLKNGTEHHQTFTNNQEDQQKTQEEEELEEDTRPTKAQTIEFAPRTCSLKERSIGEIHRFTDSYTEVPFDI